MSRNRAFIKVYFILIFSVFTVPAFSQLTVIVDAVPAYYMPLWDEVYIAGTFNTWNPGDTAYKLTEQNGKWQITFSTAPATLQFKFTRGNWAMVETQANGTQLANRNYTYAGGVDTVHCTISGWDDFQPGTHTVTSNVLVLDGNMTIPQLQNRSRRVWIYLPSDYYTSLKTYRVVYMQDGQNVFDAATSFSGEWAVDDTLHAYELAGDSASIVVAIDNGGALRLNEYCPYVNPTYGGGEGDAYADFLVQTLKPAIDSAFRTKPGRAYTAIAGSSVGAYISLYTALKYQNVFSKVGSFSPAYWFDDSLYTYARTQGMQQPLRIYQVCSQNEGPSVVSNQARMKDTLVAAGFSGSEITSVVRTYGAHNEAFWRKDFGIGYNWLFATAPSGINYPDKNETTFHAYPSPFTSLITVELNKHQEEYVNYSVFDLQGKMVLSGQSYCGINNAGFTIDTQNVLAGTYFLKVNTKDAVFRKKLLKME